MNWTIVENDDAPCPVVEADAQAYAFLVLYFYHSAPGRVLYLSGAAPDAPAAQRRVATSIHGLGAGKTALGFKIWRRGAAGANCTGANCTGANCTGANCTGANCTGANCTGANCTGEIHTGTLVSFSRESRYLYGVVEGLPYPDTPYFLVNAVTVTGLPSLVCLRREQFTVP